MCPIHLVRDPWEMRVMLPLGWGIMHQSPQKRLLPHARYTLATGSSKPVEPVKRAVRQCDSVFNKDSPSCRQETRFFLGVQCWMFGRQ